MVMLLASTKRKSSAPGHDFIFQADSQDIRQMGWQENKKTAKDASSAVFSKSRLLIVSTG
jgi:hypothetical protein